MIKLDDLILLNNDWNLGTTLEIVIFVKSEDGYTSEFCKAIEALNKYRNSKVMAFSRDRIVIEF